MSEIQNVPTFTWSDLVPVQYRSTESSSGLFQQRISSAVIYSPTGDLEVNLFENSPHIPIVDRLTLLCSALGVFSGARNIQYAGYIYSAAINASEEYLLPKGKLNNWRIVIKWELNKFNFELTIDELMQAVFFFSSIMEKSMSVQTPKTRKSSGSSGNKSSKPRPEIPEELFSETL